MKQMFGIIENLSGRYLFEYRTNQGNVKKAVFNTMERAREALDKYIIKRYPYSRFSIVQLGNIWEE